MSNELGEVLTKIGEDYKEDISSESRFYVEVDIGEKAEDLGYSDLKEAYHNVNAVVPLKKSAKGMTVRIDGRTFVNYVQLESGIAIPGYVAKEVSLPYKTYEPNDSMVLSFA
jgi:hypothetical protein